MEATKKALARTLIRVVPQMPPRVDAGVLSEEDSEDSE